LAYIKGSDRAIEIHPDLPRCPSKIRSLNGFAGSQSQGIAVQKSGRCANHGAGSD
jgi:hypothetical protein